MTAHGPYGSFEFVPSGEEPVVTDGEDEAPPPPTRHVAASAIILLWGLSMLAASTILVFLGLLLVPIFDRSGTMGPGRSEFWDSEGVYLWSMVYNVLSLPVGLALVVAGFGLLYRKRWSRWLVFVFAAGAIPLGVIDLCQAAAFRGPRVLDRLESSSHVDPAEFWIMVGLLALFVLAELLEVLAPLAFVLYARSRTCRIVLGLEAPPKAEHDLEG